MSATELTTYLFEVGITVSIRRIERVWKEGPQPMFAEECRKAAAGFPDVNLEEVLVNSFALKLAMNLQHNEPQAVKAAALIDRTMERVIAEAKTLTPDLSGKAITAQMGDAIVAIM